MHRSLLVGFIAYGSLLAQVKYDAGDKTIVINGQPFTTFHTGEDANKPFLAPLRSASGKIVTGPPLLVFSIASVEVLA